MPTDFPSVVGRFATSSCRELPYGSKKTEQSRQFFCPYELSTPSAPGLGCFKDDGLEAYRFCPNLEAAVQHRALSLRLLFRDASPKVNLEVPLGGSWAFISGVISPLIWVITTVTLLITSLITSHEPPSREQSLVTSASD